MTTFIILILLIAVLFGGNYFLLKSLQKPEGHFSNTLKVNHATDLAYLFHDLSNSLHVALIELAQHELIVFNKAKNYFSLIHVQKPIAENCSPLAKQIYQILIKNHSYTNYSVQDFFDKMMLEKEIIEKNSEFNQLLSNEGLMYSYASHDKLFFLKFISNVLIIMTAILLPILFLNPFWVFFANIVIAGLGMFLLTKLQLPLLTEEGKEYLSIRAKSISDITPNANEHRNILSYIAKQGFTGFQKVLHFV